ncbi:MAG: hypothetical protein CFE24_08520 [Flavobacterium sp. BFFFF2]|nr:MAG: hypothetical protein CFE24_08520 [Flavobacterium sp. BFFFF2]
MEPTLFYLKTCDTCKRLKAMLPSSVKRQEQDIKSEPITPQQLDFLKEKAGSYEALFSRKANLYKERGLAHETLQEADYRQLILEHYTFLKRPVLYLDDTLLIGSDPSVKKKWLERFPHD